MKSSLSSKVFPSLMRPYEDAAGLMVLDLGTASPETVKFFSQYKCRLYYADLFNEPSIFAQQEASEQSDEDAEQLLLSLFQSLLDYPQGTRFDICLLWDFLNYLNLPALRAFSLALAPYLHEQTQGHSFGMLNNKKPLANDRYSIADMDTLVSQPRLGKQLPVHPQPPSALDKNGFCFGVTRSLLLSDGRVEMLLHRPVEKAAFEKATSEEALL